MPPQVLGVLQRSCQDCHSERTAWPWYSYVAPVSWLVESDVVEGRDHLNMSHWDELNADDRTEKLTKIGTMVHNKKMPLPQYTLLHRDAKLSDAEVDLIYEWAKAEHQRLKTADRQITPSPGAK